MIRISVASYNNETADSPATAVFDRHPKTFGRSRDNHLVLNDSKNLVSRTQASIRSDGSRHTLTNLSRATPLLLNGSEVAPDMEREFRAGDSIQVGLYVLRAEAVIKSVPGGLAATSDHGAGTAGRFKPAKADHAHLFTDKPASEELASSSVDASEFKTTETAGGANALMEAFRKGAGIPAGDSSYAMTPQFMETLGKLLAASIDGIMELNRIRATVKQEAKADRTQVIVRNNNPIKFLPDSETVLLQMFRKKMPGFMSPPEAMDDVFSDLQAHHLGMVAGMRAVMNTLVQRVDPKDLEEKISDQSFLDILRPAKRKARLWDAYTELYAMLQSTSQDDQALLFGPTFLEAYEQETERLTHHAQ